MLPSSVHFLHALTDAGCSNVLPRINPPGLEPKIAARINLNKISVPLSPTKNVPLSVPKKADISSFDWFMISTSALLALLSRPWLSGIAANFADVSTTELSVKAPPAFSKKIRLPSKGQ